MNVVISQAPPVGVRQNVDHVRMGNEHDDVVNAALIRAVGDVESERVQPGEPGHVDGRGCGPHA